MPDALLNAIAAVLDVAPDTISEQTSMQTCKNWDSLRHLRIIMAVERAFGIRFSSERIPEMVSVAHLREEVSRLRPGSPS